MDYEQKSNSGRFKKGQHWRKPQPWWDREWLLSQYVSLGKSASEIAREGGVTQNAICFWLKKHGIKTRTMREVRAAKHWGLYGANNPMWNRRGELNPRWKGGVTPERQAFYTSEAWRFAFDSVWKRDKARCRRCCLRREDSPDMPMHVHHIKPFSVVELRAEVRNLVLLCESCHRFVHSRKNVHRDYL